MAKIIKMILSYKKAKKIVLFGSRAKETYSGASDIDIAILDEKWSDKDINIIKNNLEEHVKTPLKFDVVNYYLLSRKKLRGNILKYGKVIYEFGKS
jgi:predicted nucleotidyltransferase